MRNPKQIAQDYVIIGTNKASLSIGKLFVLGIMAGLFIALAAAGASTVSCTISSPSLSRILGACVFPAGLIMVLIAGSELFTGNCLMIIPLLQKKITLKQMMKNWAVVYVGNMVGALLIAILVVYSNQLSLFSGELRNYTINLAISKVSITFWEAFCKGLLCNILVCIAVWMSFGSNSVLGKVAAIFFPVMLFVLCGWEHSIANMYYIPVGLIANSANNGHIVSDSLSIGGYIFRNLIPVTLGNIAGGAGFIGATYFYVYIY